MGSVDKDSDDFIAPNVVGPSPTKKWAFQIVPHAGESLSSWILRVLRGNYVNPVPFFQETFRVDLGREDLDRSEDTRIARYFSDRMGIPMADITSLASNLPLFLLKNSDREFVKIFWVTYPKRYEKCWNGPRFCPVCIATDPEPYFRARWRLGFVTSCQEHRCLLENKCPLCHTVLRPNLLKWTIPITCCHKCGFDLSNTEPHFLAPRDETPDPDPFKPLDWNPRINRVRLIFQLARFILRFCPSTDPLLPCHPGTATARLIRMWEEARHGTGYMTALRQPLVMHFLIGIVTPLLENRGERETFLTSHHATLNSIGTKLPFSCEYCHASFSELHRLSCHLKIHAGAKLSRCSYCKKSFRTERDLRTHIQVHSEEFINQCKYCDGKFASKSSLDRHLRQCIMKKIRLGL